MRRHNLWATGLLLAVPVTAGAQHKMTIPADREPRVVILMRVDDSGHHVERMSRAVLPGKAPARRVARADAAFRYTVTSAEGVPLATGEFADPRTLRAPLPRPGEKAQGHEMAKQANGYYVIRVPESAAMRYLRIEPRATAGLAVAKGAANGAGKTTGAAQVIDLAHIDIR